MEKNNHSIPAEMERAKIWIPYATGRNLLGVMDETGELNYGEVFIQISGPSHGTGRRIVKGKS